MAATELGVGLVGAGLIGSLHGLCLRAAIERARLPVKLVHVADVDARKAERFRRGFGFARSSGDAEAVLRDPEVDAVYVCTWTSEHPRLVMAAAAEKKHVFCEKPLAVTAREAALMHEAVKRAGVTHQVGLVLRQGPVWNALRHELGKNGHGLPLALVFRDDQCFPIKGAHPSAWRKDAGKAGHGTLIEHSIHDLDLLEWMFGPVSSVQARTASRFGHRDIEDLARVDLEFQSGMAGSLVSVWHDVEQRHSNRRLEIFHEKTFCAVEAEFTGEIQIMRGAGRMETWSESQVNERFWELRGIADPAIRELSLMIGALADYLFLKAVLDGEPASPGFEAAVRAHELVDACYESAATGDRISTLDSRELE
ncbi:MAG TPA: Gfo/Idh/MocA family oxidoreductase [bacterium]|nr:Gfo/Idh/MocA family oxidoreductase [bacterium]